MARSWRCTKLSLSSALLLSFSGMCFALLSLYFCCFCVCFCFVFVFMLLSLELCRYSSGLFLSSRTRTGLALLGMVEARSVNVKNTHTRTHTHTFSVLVTNPKNSLHTMANPARGLLNQEKRTKEKVWQHPPTLLVREASTCA